MNPTRVDLNSDLGEGFGVWRLGDDEALLEIVTSANVACGFHAGDPDTLRRVCAKAAEGGVAIGAQVGYRDLAGFGRRAIDVPPSSLTNEVIYQIGALDAFARPTEWQAIQRRGMKMDFSWDASAREYVKVYEGAVAAARQKP